MKEELQKFARQFGTFVDPVPVLSEPAWSDMIKKIQVVMPAGGESKRMRSIVKKGYNKISMPLPNGDTLLEYNIRMYRQAGIRDIRLLIAQASDSIQKLIGDGSKLDIDITYCEESGLPLAKGGAVRLALENNLLDKDKYMIIHNAGDIFFGYPGDIPREIVSAHLAFEKQGSIATIVTAPMSMVQGSMLKVVDSYVESIAFEPYVPMPYHTNATVFSPAVFDWFEKLFPLGEKIEFESVLFPALAKEHKLTAVKIDNQYSLQVKNEKQWAQLLERFKK